MAKNKYSEKKQPLNIILLVVSIISSLAGLFTLLPSPVADIPNILGYFSFSPFAPAVTFYCLLLASLSFTLRTHFFKRDSHGKRRPLKQHLFTLIPALLFLCGGIWTTLLWLDSAAQFSAAVVTEINTTLPSGIPDGTYTGKWAEEAVAAEVELVVTGGKVTSGKLVSARNVSGRVAEILFRGISDKQSLAIDAVAGATASSSVVLKACEQAFVSAVNLAAYKGIYYCRADAKIVEISEKAGLYFLLFYNVDKNMIVEKSKQKITDLQFHQSTATYAPSSAVPASAQYTINGTDYTLFFLGREFSTFVNLYKETLTSGKSSSNIPINSLRTAATYLRDVRIDSPEPVFSENEFSIEDLLKVIGRYETDTFYQYTHTRTGRSDLESVFTSREFKEFHEPLLLDISIAESGKDFVYTFPKRVESSQKHQHLLNYVDYQRKTVKHVNNLFLFMGKKTESGSLAGTHFIRDNGKLDFIHYNGDGYSYYVLKASFKKVL